MSLPRASRFAHLALRLAACFAICEPSPSSAAPAFGVNTEGKAVLRKCRDFLITVSCKEFNHIDIPPRVRVGDSFEVVFSSNIKSFTFTVRSIDLTGGTCRLSDVEFPEEDPAADQLVSSPCSPAP